MDIDWSRLIEMATKVMEYAYAPYSGIRVGAALLCRDGRVFTGVNIENASYGLTICAERVAVFNAISSGCRDFVALVIASNTEDPLYPCGACSQVLAEFVEDIEILSISTTTNKSIKIRLSQVLPIAKDLRNRIANVIKKRYS